MNEIDLKRKELEKIYNKEALEFYDVGIRDAQKEFLEFLQDYAKGKPEEICDCEECIKYRNKIEELKKAVDGK